MPARDFPVPFSYKANLSKYVRDERIRFGGTTYELAKVMTEKTGIPITHACLNDWERGKIKNELRGKSLKILAAWTEKSIEETHAWLWRDSSDLTLIQVLAWIEQTSAENLLVARDAANARIGLIEGNRSLQNLELSLATFDVCSIPASKEEEEGMSVFTERIKNLLELSLRKHTELRGKNYTHSPGILATDLGYKDFSRPALQAALRGELFDGNSGQELQPADWNALAGICFRAEFQGTHPVNLSDSTFAGDPEGLKRSASPNHNHNHLSV